MKIKKFTFKEHRPTGKFRSFEQTYCDIKLNTKKVGSIVETSHFENRPFEERVVVKFAIKDEISRFKWITLKKKFPYIKEAKEWLSQEIIYKSIQEKYDLYQFEK